MGQGISRLTRPLRNFNIENRASKALEKRQKIPEPAPKHATTAKKLQRFREENQEVLEAQMEKDETLHENLKKVYVESKDPQVQTSTSTKPLPLDRKPQPESELGVMDTLHEVPEGRVNLKTVLSFIGQHQGNREAVTAATIAEEHKLDKTEVQNVLNHFKVLQLHIPQEMYKENKDMHKIISEQLKTGKEITSTVRLPGGGNQKKLESKPPLDEDLSQSKT